MNQYIVIKQKIPQNMIRITNNLKFKIKKNYIGKKTYSN